MRRAGKRMSVQVQALNLRLSALAAAPFRPAPSRRVGPSSPSPPRPAEADPSVRQPVPAPADYEAGYSTPERPAIRFVNEGDARSTGRPSTLHRTPSEPSTTPGPEPTVLGDARPNAIPYTHDDGRVSGAWDYTSAARKAWQQDPPAAAPASSAFGRVVGVARAVSRASASFREGLTSERDAPVYTTAPMASPSQGAKSRRGRAPVRPSTPQSEPATPAEEPPPLRHALSEGPSREQPKSDPPPTRGRSGSPPSEPPLAITPASIAWGGTEAEAAGTSCHVAADSSERRSRPRRWAAPDEGRARVQDGPEH